MVNKTYGIFYNENSGSGEAKKIAHRLASSFDEVNCLNEYLVADTVDKVINKIKKSLDHIDTLVVIGGDGTINIGITAMIQAKQSVNLAVIPSGTVNNFARYYQIPTDIDAAIELIIKEHSDLNVGIISCNKEKTVISSLTFGNLADISNGVRQQEKRKFGKIIYVAKAIKHIGRNKSFKIKYVFDDGTNETLKTWFTLITTIKSVGGHIYTESAPNKMHMSILHNIGFRQLLPYVWFSLTGKLSASKSITQYHVSTAHIDSVNENQSITTRIDGDKSVSLPIDLEYLPDYLTLTVPSNH